MENFEPVIVAFCCHYCAYTAADMAGSMRISYPPNVKIIRVPCSGKVDVIHLMKAIEKGADGVYIAGCLEGDCHFRNGNVKAKRRLAHVRKILDDIGIGGERVEMFEMSAGMGDRFAQVATDFTEKIRKLGPNPAKVARAA
ncbi:hydrogenase iron-sulfur subunit [Desulfobacca acetoxidans]|uniref:Methyl-viologen-reducing hydrogenase delta subunit n=1 Tax=Desulfobacca acetoxidans (strain ATCC 700848 / DSM 11109 / ASRB2) TaxID=880072 RepID=F2NEL3_DESAR|nr:hydrogenase iron-sulfur subunit [Desulfobacca acetoxidans]AEB08203.1 methyl-viologen-reducing hydrogenase delta subunit [Desulfobacca acetoxidans DSM 11109]HAY22313.1 hydrogenase iron-sulfur subunit [Desulfobacterales bacterium]